MSRFDLPNRSGPAKTIMHPRGRERVFDLPYDTENPEDQKLLRKHSLLVESETPAPEHLEIPEEKPAKPSRKEVTDDRQ